MKYNRFEDLPVWKLAHDTAVRIFLLTDDLAFRGRADLKNQLERAAASVTNNIAEGFERGTTDQLITFLYYAKGSAGEVRNMLHIVDALPWLSHLKSEISNLKSQIENVSRQLGGWADSLQNSDIKGFRHLTDAAREQSDQKRRAEAFIANLNEINQAAAAERERKRLEAMGNVRNGDNSEL